MPRVSLYLTTLLLAAVWSAHAEITPPLESRELISTGDVLPGLGRIGGPSFNVNGIDDRGRVLFGAHLSDGRLGLFLATGQRVSPLWTSSAGSPHLRVHNARISPNGRVLAFASSGAFDSPASSLYEVRREGLARLLEEGATTADGDRLCTLYDMAINDGDDVVLHATATLNDACDDAPTFQALYRLHDGRVQRIGERDNYTGWWSLAGLRPSGHVVMSRRDDIIEVDDEGSRTLVAAWQPGPSGAPFEWFGSAHLGAAGHVVFTAVEDNMQGLYRLGEDGIRRIVAESDATPSGETIQFIYGAYVDGAGQVVAAVYLRPVPGGPTEAVIRYAADGTGGMTVLNASGPVLNRAGQIAIHRVSSDRIDVARWTADRVVSLVDSEAVAPGGGHYVARGLDSLDHVVLRYLACLDASGRTVLRVRSGREDAVVCVDADGSHVVARTGTEGDDALRYLGGCAFAADDLFIAAAPLDGPLSVYHATDGSPQRVLGPGDVVDDLGEIESLRSIAPGDKFFAANSRGSLLVSAAIDGQTELLLHGADGTWTRLAAPTSSLSSPSIFEAGLTDDDRAVAFFNFHRSGEEANENLVVLADGEQARVLARANDAEAPGGPYWNFGDLQVRGSRAAFIGYGESTALLTYDADTDELRALPLLVEEQYRDLHLLDLTAAGEVLYEIDDGTNRRIVKLIDPSGTVRIMAQGGASDPLPVLVSDAGHVLLGTRESPHGALRQTIALSGPETSAACPGVTAAPTPRSTEDDGCQIGGAPSPSAWPLLALALLLAARRSRACAREAAQGFLSGRRLPTP